MMHSREDISQMTHSRVDTGQMMHSRVDTSQTMHNRENISQRDAHFREYKAVEERRRCKEWRRSKREETQSCEQI